MSAPEFTREELESLLGDSVDWTLDLRHAVAAYALALLDRAEKAEALAAEMEGKATALRFGMEQAERERDDYAHRMICEDERADKAEAALAREREARDEDNRAMLMVHTKVEDHRPGDNDLGYISILLTDLQGRGPLYDFMREHIANALTEYGEMVREACAAEVEFWASTHPGKGLIHPGEALRNIRALDVRVEVEDE